jgi:hypothetical protein
MADSDPSIIRPLPETAPAVQVEHKAMDIGRWYKASFTGTICCIILYTVYGFIFVHAHALSISGEMELLQKYHMIPLISPADVHLVSFIHLLGSALMFGLTLGILNALVCMCLTLSLWVSSSFKIRDMMPLLLSPITAIYFGLSDEMPFVSILFGVICPFAFVLPWLYMLKKSRPSRIVLKRWLLVTGILVAPFIVIALMRPSYLIIRDVMLETPLVKNLSDIYYAHTLLAADVIKPPAARTQNVIAVSRSVGDIGPMPHGSLWIRTADPCSIQEAHVVVSKERLTCRAIVLKDNLPANEKGRIFREYGAVFDLNRHMRNGIGLYYYSGPFAVGIILLFSWLAVALVNLSYSSRTAVMVLLGIYLILFIPFFHTGYLALNLRMHPEQMGEYKNSGEEKKIYLMTVMYPGALSLADLDAMIRKGSTRVKINALVEAGERRDPALTSLIGKALDDSQINVRTKACWALGRMASPQTMPMLERVLRNDPSWYVRDYAYAALGAMRYDTKIVDLD